MLPNPVGSGEPAPPRRVGSVEPGKAPPHRPSEEGWVGGPGQTRLALPPLRGGVARPAASVRPLPRGGLASPRPRWSGGRSGASPVLSAFPLGIVLPEKGERLCAGRSHSLELLAAAPRRGVQVPRLLRVRRSAFGASAGSASAPRAPKRLWCICGRSVGVPLTPRRGWAARVRLCAVFPSGPRAFGIPALPKLCGTGRSAEAGRVLEPPRRFQGALLVARERCAAVKALRRGAPPSVSLSWAEAHVREGASLSSALCGKPRGVGEGFPLPERAKATAPVVKS
jgi:hypothetical protein